MTKYTMLKLMILTLALMVLPDTTQAIEGAEIGMYADGVWTEGLIAFEHFLDWKGLTHERIMAADVNGHDLTEYYEAVVIPGGDMFGYRADISQAGIEHLQEFIQEGHGYVGICGGGYFAADSIYFQGIWHDFPLNLFDGTANGPLNIASGYGMTTISLNPNHPINQFEPPQHVTLYSGGAGFYAHARANDVATYDEHNDDSAMITCPFGNGRVLLIGPHPEFEEDSDRDGSAYGDEFDDEGSDWGLLWSAMDWVLGRAITDTIPSNDVLLIPHTIDGNFDGPGGVFACDVDGDGATDVLGAAYAGGEVAWWRNDGSKTPSWEKQVIDDGFNGAIFVHAGNVDGDASAEVVGAAWAGNEVALWHSDGGSPIQWSKQTIDANAANAHEVYIVDLDMDGDDDVLAAIAGNDAIVWYRNDGESPIVWTRLTIGDGFDGARSARPADIDLDGDIDVVGASLDGDEVTWWRNDGGDPIEWTEFTITNTYNGSHMVRISDVNEDGRPDIFGAAYAINNISWWRNDGGDPVQWTKQTIAGSFAGAVGVQPADIDGDGDIDVVGTAQPSSQIAWWRNDGGEPISWVKQPLDDNFAQVWPVYADDIDNNGTIDIIAGGNQADEIRWWENRTGWLLPDFDADPLSGHAPLTVQFTDITSANPSVDIWRWDFNNDGAIDAQDQNPTWVYSRPGTYGVTLELSNGLYTETLAREDFVRVFDGESGLEFDGESGHALCSASPSLNLTDGLTVEAWIEPQGWGEVSGSGYGRIVDKTDFALYVHGESSAYNDHSLMFLLRNESGPPSVAATPVGTIQLGEWQHVAVTYDGESVVALYINGEEQPIDQTNTPSGPIKDNETSHLIIGNSGTNTYTFDGVIDEFRIWNVARPGEQLQDAMEDYLNGDEPGLVGYWKFNEGSGSTISDETTFGNHGIIAGARWAQGTTFEPPVPVDEPRLLGATQFSLRAQYPNPFGPSTLVEFELPHSAHVNISIFDLSGRLVRTLIDEERMMGVQKAVWTGEDNRGRAVPSGAYLFRMRSGEFSASRRCMLIR